MSEHNGKQTGNGLLDEEDLKAWLHVRSRAKLIRWLDARDLPYLLSPDGRVVTEIGAISRALSSANDGDWDKLEFGNART